MGTLRTKPSEVGPEELRGLLALQHAMQTGAELRRRYALGMRTEKIGIDAGYALWGVGAENQIYCVIAP